MSAYAVPIVEPPDISPQSLADKIEARSRELAAFYERSAQDESRSRSIGEIEKLKRCRRVRRLDTGEVFDCATHAARSFGKNYCNQILRACNDGRLAWGMEWRYVDRFGKNIPPISLGGVRPQAKAVVVNGVSYRSMKEAGKKFGVTGKAVSAWLKRGGRKRGKIRIEFADSRPPE